MQQHSFPLESGSGARKDKVKLVSDFSWSGVSALTFGKTKGHPAHRVAQSLASFIPEVLTENKWTENSEANQGLSGIWLLT